MNNPEIIIILINLMIMIISYCLIFPAKAGSNIKKLLLFDLIAMIIAFSISGSIFINKTLQFNIVFANVNWFWFTLITYIILEFPFAVWYLRKFDIWSNFDQE